MQMGTDDEHAGGVSSGQGDLRHGIGEVSDMTGISAFTIRYYDKCGFFPDLARDKRGVRSFSEDDVAQLHLIEYQRDELDLSLQRLHAATMELSAEHDGERP